MQHQGPSESDPSGAKGHGAKRTRQNEGQPVTEEALDGVAAVGEPAANGGQVEEEGEKGSKQRHVATSCIHGTAMPHRPRVGPEFQAVVPAWAGPPPSDSARPASERPTTEHQEGGEQ
mmetsp:Transcript_26099/g.46407  ORF Transcript_26099/g.46407 Transcript_26099/m.46407 type:complete len:118 (-) Transcript_26099:2500-2853(-)